MEDRAKMFALMLLVALILGVAVVGLHPAYRETFRALLRGEPEASPLWLSNQSYHPEVMFRGAVTNDVGR